MGNVFLATVIFSLYMSKVKKKKYKRKEEGNGMALTIQKGQRSRGWGRKLGEAWACALERELI